jgi:hypothetical protein
MAATALLPLAFHGNLTAQRRTLAPFTAVVSNVSVAELGKSWHAGCPVGPSQLRAIHLRFVDFRGRSQFGTIVVASTVTAEVERIFATLYARRFPLHTMIPLASFSGSDVASMAADNTSGFNCRYAVAPGPPVWSVHAYGEAIDVNTVENPYLEGGKVLPPAGSAFLNRHDLRPGMATPGSTLNAAFAAAGWQWGGRWTVNPDYQHFSLTGG